MDKNQISRGTHASVLSTVNRPLLWARFFLLALFVAFSSASLQSRASVQAADQTIRINKITTASDQLNASALHCPECQEALVTCLGNAGGDDCWIDYDICVANCH